jgi:ABC-type transport system substrate-binding protein
MKYLEGLKGIKKLTTLTGWRQFFKVLTKKEKIALSVFFVLFLTSFSFLIINFYLKNSEIKPSYEGVFTEGVIGAPRFINPIYASSDTDRDLTELIYSGLMKYDENSKIVPSLAKDYEIKEGGKIYEIYLRENLFWSDGTPLSADDVIFTVETIQNSDFKSPLRINWFGVEVEKISDSGVRFKLKNPYPPFLENLTLKIIPKHIWENVPAQNFPLAIYNLRPVGSGPYKLKEIEQEEQGFIKSLTLVSNPYFFGKKPYIPKIKFLFFDQEDKLIEAVKKGKVEGFSLLTSMVNVDLKKYNIYNLSLPRYFAVFFNPDKLNLFKDKNLRQAFNYGTNKEEIIKKFFEGKAKIVHSPILPEIYGFKEPSKIYQFDLEKAKEILDRIGFVESAGRRIKIIKKEAAFQFKSELKLGSRGKEVEELQKCLARFSDIYPEGKITAYFGEDTKKAVIKFQEKYKKEILEPWGFKEGSGIVGKSTRAKLNEICFPSSEETLPLSFSLATVNQPLLIEVASELKNQWKNLGAEVEIKTFDPSQLKEDVIKPRNYESLLFGEILGAIPDPFPFWHSSQKKDPGLNLALYEKNEVDKLLEEARQIQDFDQRAEKYAQFQEILIEDAPAIFLYSPDYLYFVSKEIKGIRPGIIVDPSKRFAGIEEWYIKTRRVWK